MDYYNRCGELISRDEFADKISDSTYKIIAQHTIRGWLVSTVWLGIDHGLRDGQLPPLIFETMVFGPNGSGGDEYFCERYSTQEDAENGHYEAMAWLANKLGPESIHEIENYDPHSEG